MVPVGSRLRKEVDDAVARASHLCGEPPCQNLELLVGVPREIGQRTALHFVNVCCTIDGHGAAAPKLPAELTSSVLVLVGSNVGAGRLPGIK